MEKGQIIRLISSLIISGIVLTLTACSMEGDDVVTPPEPSIDYTYNNNENIQYDIESYIDSLLYNTTYDKQVSVLDGTIRVDVDVYLYSENEATSLLYTSDDITMYIQSNYDYESLAVDVELHYEYLD